MKLAVLVLLAGCAAVPPPVDDVAPAAPAAAAQLDAIEADIAGQTAARGPLAGEARAAQDAILLGLPEAAAARARIEAALRAAGQARCTALDTSTPYESWIVARYCAHFSVTRHARPLPGLFGSLAVTGGVGGETPDEAAATTRALDGALRESSWYAPGAPALAATLSGDLEATLAAVPAQRTATWTEAVPYTVSVRSWDFERPWDYDDVVRYRHEDRSMTYDVIERDGRYASQLHIGVAALGVGASATDASAQHGDDTNAFDDRAGVAPTRANLPTHEAYAARQQATLAANLRTELERGYREQFCERDTYTLEAAAACAYQDAAAAPPAVHAALRATFRDEEPLLAPLLGH